MKRITLIRAILLVTILILCTIIHAYPVKRTITITLESTGISSSSYGNGIERTWVQNDISFGAKAVMKNGINMQMQAKNGVLYNTTPLPGRIIGVELTSQGQEQSSYCFVGNSKLVNSTTEDYNIKGGKQIGSASTTGWADIDFAETDYKYFAIKRGENVLVLSKIEIVYEDFSSIIAPTFSVSPGNYETPQTIEISTETEGAQIFYTINNSNPTTESTLYTEALFIDSSTTVKAIAYKDGEESQISEATYTIIYPFTVSLNAGSGACDVIGITEEAAEKGVMLPAAFSCSEEWTFEGWAGIEIKETTIEPIFYPANDIYYPTADITLYAVYSQDTGNITTGDIIINAKTLTDLSASYVDRTWIQDGISFRGNKVFRGTQGGLIQMNPEQGDGMLFNTTPISGLKSITINRSSGENPLTVYQGKSSPKPTSLSAGVLTGDGTINISPGNEYFNIKAGGTIYISEIIINRNIPALIYNSNPVCSIIDSPLPTITIWVGGEGVEFTDVDINKSGEDMIYLIADKITEEMSVAITGNDKELFTYNLRDFNHTTGGYIYIYYSPKETGSHAAVLEINSGNINAVVPLSGTAINSGTGTGLNNASTFNFFSICGRICFMPSVAGESVEIYNLSGQLIYQGVSMAGLNTIFLEPGFVLIKIGNILNKLIIK